MENQVRLYHLRQREEIEKESVIWEQFWHHLTIAERHYWLEKQRLMRDLVRTSSLPAEDVQKHVDLWKKFTKLSMRLTPKRLFPSRD
jgi:hypothetical protein